MLLKDDLSTDSEFLVIASLGKLTNSLDFLFGLAHLLAHCAQTQLNTILLRLKDSTYTQIQTIQRPNSLQLLNKTNHSQDDIVDETLKLFKANVFFYEFEIKCDADRALIYCMLYITG